MFYFFGQSRIYIHGDTISLSKSVLYLMRSFVIGTSAFISNATQPRPKSPGSTSPEILGQLLYKML